MKAVLEFTLPDEETEFIEAVNGGMFKHVLWQLDQKLRSKLKYGELPEEQYKCYETIRKDLYRLLNANNLTIE
jgi:hypothetical protein